MKKLFMAGTAMAFAIGGITSLSAQGIVDEAPEEVVEENNGAIVTRENIEEERKVLDESDVPVLNDDGTTQTEIVTTGFTQTVETPSGNVHTITKVDGSRAIVTHERPEKAERADKAEKPDRPDKPERPDKPDKPDRPGKPG
jgi:hypothetical protein